MQLHVGENQQMFKEKRQPEIRTNTKEKKLTEKASMWNWRQKMISQGLIFTEFRETGVLQEKKVHNTEKVNRLS